LGWFRVGDVGGFGLDTSFVFHKETIHLAHGCNYYMVNEVRKSPINISKGGE